MPPEAEVDSHRASMSSAELSLAIPGEENVQTVYEDKPHQQLGGVDLPGAGLAPPRAHGYRCARGVPSSTQDAVRADAAGASSRGRAVP
eukprot:CAMPEP_0182909024 /NCGR_PEP_ID=MMETSP0034_2-20130328/35532_1 /TAXON_ID=156128 /ORGANISM="Nephroselmis pyriformis, Strain CCMP717" /LENGTH=88 /DNA_ID=CAMNT_0025045249 /DNA_START=29 /DNA_END=290 /DNA_ORIENTATION=+